MQAANRLQKALKTGSGRTFGVWQMLPGTNVSRALCSPGYDWVLVDTEHGNIDDAAMHEAVSAIAYCGLSPVVRVPAGEAWMFKRALDTGAHGLMVPLISTVEDARNAVKYSKFPPVGVRGFGSPFPMQTFGKFTSSEYLQQANDSILTILQIETKEALENVDEIAAVEGVDVLFVGPFDLGNSIGHPVIGPSGIDEELAESIQRVLDAANNAGKRAGIFSVDGKQAAAFASQGFHMISVVADVLALGAYLTESLIQARADIVEDDDTEDDLGAF